MVSLQIALQPIVWRFPWHVPHTHRAAALQYTDGDFGVIEEDLGVQFAIFMFGRASPDQRPQTSTTPTAAAEHAPAAEQTTPTMDDHPRNIIQAPDEEIPFPPELKLPSSIKTAIKRTHKNLGHPRPAELKKLLALNGVNNQSIYAAVEGLRCHSCERTKGPTRPDLGSIPVEDGCSQFGDRLQTDTFYVRDVSGENFMVQGVIDEVAHLHVSTVLDDRQPETTCAAFVYGWARHFGFPLRLRVDPDGSYR